MILKDLFLMLIRILVCVIFRYFQGTKDRLANPSRQIRKCQDRWGTMVEIPQLFNLLAKGCHMDYVMFPASLGL